MLKATIHIKDIVFMNICAQNSIVNTFKRQNISQIQGNRSKRTNRRFLTHHFQYKTDEMNKKLLKSYKT